MILFGTPVTLSEVFVVGFIGAIVSVVVALLTNGLQFFKWKNGERVNIDSESANLIADAAESLIKPLKEEIQSLRVENIQLKQSIIDNDKKWNDKFGNLERDYIEMQRNNSLLANWAERLVHQVYSLDETPVPLIPKQRTGSNKVDTKPLNINVSGSEIKE